MEFQKSEPLRTQTTSGVPNSSPMKYASERQEARLYPARNRISLRQGACVRVVRSLHSYGKEVLIRAARSPYLRVTSSQQ